MPTIRRENDLQSLLFPGGMNNVAREDALPASFCRDAQNVDIRDDGSWGMRDGYVLRKSIAGGSSLFASENFPYMLARKGDTLIAYNDALSEIVLATGLGAVEASYTEIDGRVLWVAEDRASGVLDSNLNAGPLGVPDPGGVPHVVATTGYGLRAGKYQVALSAKLDSGEESGCGPATLIEVGDNGGIAVTLPPDPGSPIEYFRVWCSRTNGNVMELVRDVPAGLPTFTFGEGMRGRDLDAQFLVPMPKGHIVRSLNGITWVAYKNRVWYSEPFRPGLCHGGTGYFEFAARVDMMEPCGTGARATMYVGAGNKVYKLQGALPREMTQDEADTKVGAVPGTGCSVPADLFVDGADGAVAYWFGRDGVPRVAGPLGAIRRLTKDTVAMTQFEQGNTVLREVDGRRVLITAGRGGGAVTGFGARDTAEVFHYRNGILID
jgi:hypothetical protein